MGDPTGVLRLAGGRTTSCVVYDASAG